MLLNKPNLINVINGHVSSGVYKQITDEIERRETMGSVDVNLSDLQKYELVGSQMFANAAPTSNALATTTYQPTKAAEGNPQLKQRKKALGSRKTAGAKKVATEVDFSKMSDDEIMAL